MDFRGDAYDKWTKALEGKMNHVESKLLFKARYGRNSLYSPFLLMGISILLVSLIFITITENPYAFIGVLLVILSGWVFLRTTFKLRYIEVFEDRIVLPLLRANEASRSLSICDINNFKLVTQGVPLITLTTSKSEIFIVSLLNMQENDFYSLFILLKNKISNYAEVVPAKSTEINKVTYIVLVIVFFISPLLLMYLVSFESVKNSFAIFRTFVFISLPILGGVVHSKIIKNLSSDLNGHVYDLTKPEITNKRNLYGQVIIFFFYIFLVGSVIILRQIKGVEIPNGFALMGFIFALVFTSLFQFTFRSYLKCIFNNEFIVYTITLLLFGFLFFTTLYTFLTLKFPQLSL